MGKWITSTMDVRVLGNRSYELLSIIRYEDDNGQIYEAPIGLKTDFGSTWGIPLISSNMDGFAQMACALHDHNYETGLLSRECADNLLKESSYAELVMNGMATDKAEDLANTFYYGVRIFGRSHYNKKEGIE